MDHLFDDFAEDQTLTPNEAQIEKYVQGLQYLAQYFPEAKIRYDDSTRRQKCHAVHVELLGSSDEFDENKREITHLCEVLKQFDYMGITGDVKGNITLNFLCHLYS